MPAPSPRSSSNFNPWLALMSEPPDTELVDAPAGGKPYNPNGFKPVPPPAQPDGLAGMLGGGGLPPGLAGMLGGGAAAPNPPVGPPAPPPSTNTPAMAPGYHAAGPNVVASPGAAGAPPASQPPSPLQAAGSNASPLSGGPALVPGQPQGGLPGFMGNSAGLAGMIPALKAALTGGGKSGGPLPELSDNAYLGEMQPTEGRKSTASGELKAGEADTHVGAIGDPEFAKALSRVVNQPLPGMKLEQDDVKNLRAGIEALVGQERKKSPFDKMDLSPLMALSDTWFGGNLSKGYHQPADGREFIGKLTKQLSDSESKLTGHQVDYLKAQLQDKSLATLGMMLGGDRTSSAGGLGGGGKGQTIGPGELIRIIQHDQDKKTAESDKHSAAATTYIKDQDASGIGPMYTAMQRIDAILGKSKEAGQKSPPGFVDKSDLGPLGKLVPNGFMMQTPDALRFNPDAKELAQQNEVIKASIIQRYSGKVATDQEVRRKASQLGQAYNQTPEQYVAALKDLQESIRRAEAAKRSVMHPDERALVDKSEAYGPDDFGFKFGEGVQPKAKGAPSSAAEVAPKNTNEVERMTDDGTIAVFDKRTKKFLRMKDAP